jgi:ATP-dependent Clp protease ATP-binding subunit ClpA
MYPFERFTDRAKKVLTLAQDEAEAAGQRYIGTEHLLLGLLREEEGVARKALDSLGAWYEPVRDAIQAELDTPRKGGIQRIIPTSRVKKVIELAFEECRRQGHANVGTGHLLLGLLIEGEGVAAQVLVGMGVTLERAREEIDRLFVAGVTEPATEDQPRPRPAGPVAMSPDLRELLGRAQVRAAQAGSSTVGLDHLLEAVAASAGLEAVARLLDWRGTAAKKEQAIAAQQFEAAAGHRADEKRAAAALEEAIAAWRRELEPPAQAG